MKILSVTTSSSICSTAILEDTTCIKELTLNNGLTHSESLMPLIKQLLDETKTKLNEINLLACDIGPGSFTGIRIGIATLKAFSDSLNIPTIGVNSLEALKYNEIHHQIICPIIDAKKNNVYTELFKEDFIIIPPSFYNIDELLLILTKEFKNSNIVFIGDGAFYHKEKIKSKFSNCIINPNLNLSAYNIGLIGYKKYNNSNNTKLEPLYLRKTSAEQNMEAKNESN